MTLSDLDCLSEIFNDTKRAQYLRQLSFLFRFPRAPDRYVHVRLYWVSLLQCQFHWMQQLLSATAPICDTDQFSTLYCCPLCCLLTVVWYNLLYWGNRIGVGRPFLTTNQSTFSGSLLISKQLCWWPVIRFLIWSYTVTSFWIKLMHHRPSEIVGRLVTGTK